MSVRTALCAALVVAFSAAGSRAQAQTAPVASTAAHGFALDRFEPSEPGSEWFVHDTLDLRGEVRPAMGLVLDYGYKPYILVNPDGSENTSIISDQLFVHIGGSIVFLSRFRVGVSLPVLLTQDGSATGGVVNGQRVVGSTSGGIGDLRLGADVRLFGNYGEPLTLAAGGRVWLPTGDSKNYLGDGAVRAGPQVAAAGDVHAFVYSASLGVVYRANTSGFAGHPTGSEATFGAAAGVRVLEKKLVIGPEIWASTVLADGFGARTTPVALVAGAHYTAGDFRVGAGLGPGLSHAAGTSIFRALASIEYVPPFAKVAEVAKVAEPAARDRDAISAPENAPLDRDGDGVVDGQDACPDVAGVHSEDPKTNGCPPDPDRDKDGVLNDVDACPDAAGPRSEDPKTTGCPRVSIKNAQIQILDQPKFDLNEAVIKRESDSLLSDVAQVMNDHMEVKHVTVEGHTDSAGSAELNKALSRRRAEAVVKWLVDHGVSLSRLSARGMGKDEPIMPNDTDAGRAANRRVEFHIEAQDTTTHLGTAP
jgi:outer membrane protein OmpA-like peptidoglycan-associated protein